MSGTSGGCVLENARIVHHDDIAAKSLAFEDGRVAAGRADAYRLDLAGHFIYPGLINAHDHLQLNNVPRVPHERPFANSYEWIEAVERHRADPAVIEALSSTSAARHWQGGLKNLLGGATTVAHHDPWREEFDDPDFPVRVVPGIGWSHSLGLGAGERPRYGPGVEERFASTPAETPWIIHLAEGIDSLAASELGALDAMGCLAENTVLVHGVGLTDGDITRVIERGAAVVWCPASNVELFGRTLEPAALFAAGRLTLGTDSRLTGSRDLLDEMRVAMASSELTARECLRMVTRDASRILRIPGCGRLHIGDNADCVILRAEGDPYVQLAGARRADIRAVARNGRPVITDPDLADWFLATGIEAVPIRLDGREKLIAHNAARPDVLRLEPGVELLAADC